MVVIQNIHFSLFASIVVLFVLYTPSGVSACDPFLAQRLQCQINFFPQLTTALSTSPKAMIIVDKNANVPICRMQCQLKTGLKTVTNLGIPIPTPDFVPCSTNNGKFSKQTATMICFNGACLTIAQIVALPPAPGGGFAIDSDRDDGIENDGVDVVDNEGAAVNHHHKSTSNRRRTQNGNRRIIAKAEETPSPVSNLETLFQFIENRKLFKKLGNQ